MTSVAQTRFGIVGSGWRGEFFLRLARLLPERLRVTGVVTRTESRGAAVTAEWGVPTFRTTAELLAHERPDFVIVSVPWPVTPEVTRELVAAGVPVLAETPPAPDLAGLRSLWADVGGSGLVQVAEQYLLMPGHAARLAVVRAGVLGEPTSVQISSTHLYHAVSLIRGLLGVGHESAEVSARAFVAPLANPLSPAGWSGDDTPQQLSTTLATHRLRRADGFVRLHRQPVVEPAADPPVGGAGLARRAGGRPGRPPGRPHHAGGVVAEPTPDRSRPQPGRARPEAHQLRRRRGLPQPVRRQWDVRRRHRGGRHRRPRPVRGRGRRARPRIPSPKPARTT